ncbi:hypothetical protein LUZ61_011647 [Rhynchospora tenuis]|uniref:NB-ARC domain-containing protein n=1 Tax=Rhynchospora tenuis TaxID=198213 RepID=A0AAD6A1G2_9POAL|nr:hypothetical protein LUZ61_011647 [Rhynchospora tenuis]
MATSRDTTSSEPPLVGFEIDKRKILSALLDTSEQKLSIVNLFGGRGVGKTFLAKNIYTSAEVQRHFDVQVWLPGANCHSLEEAEKCTREQLSIEDEADISNFLRGKRYCVVLDDFNYGSRLASLWHSIIERLPDNSNGSRVLVTRDYDIIILPGRSVIDSLPLLQIKVYCRSNKQGLEILLKEAFPKDPLEGCPADTVDALVMECQGLPWPLRFLGGLLSERPWNEVLGRIEAIKAAGKRFVDFAKSYRFLPSHEHRAAFLYFLTFPEDAEIHAKSLAR